MVVDFFSRTFDVVRHSSDFKHRLLVSWWSYDVCVRLLLNSFDRGSFWTHNETNNSIRYSNVDCSLSRSGGARWPRSKWIQAVVLSLSSNLRKVLCSWNNFAFGQSYIFFPPRYYEDGIFTTYRCFDVSVRLRSQSLDFATWNTAKHKNTSNTRGFRKSLS